MKSFTFTLPTEVRFGTNEWMHVGELLLKYHAKKVMILYGSRHAKASGLLDSVAEQVGKAGMDYILFGGIEPNPKLSRVYEGIQVGKEAEVDFLLAIGGGSVIDTAKAVAAGLADETVDVWDYFSTSRRISKALPVGSIVTMPASGSEVWDALVITDDRTNLKRSTKSAAIRCTFSILDPSLTVSLNLRQTEIGCADIVMHTMERYFTNEFDCLLTDAVAETLMRQILGYMTTIQNNPDDYTIREQIMWCATLSHNGITGCGHTGDWACHTIEHEISGEFDVPHGAGLTAIWGSWARYVMPKNVERFYSFAVNVMGVPADASCKEAVALEGINRLCRHFRSVNLPTSLGELGIVSSPEIIDLLADRAVDHETHTIGHLEELKKSDIITILRMAV